MAQVFKNVWALSHKEVKITDNKRAQAKAQGKMKDTLKDFDVKNYILTADTLGQNLVKV